MPDKCPYCEKELTPEQASKCLVDHFPRGKPVGRGYQPLEKLYQQIKEASEKEEEGG